MKVFALVASLGMVGAIWTIRYFFDLRRNKKKKQEQKDKPGSRIPRGGIVGAYMGLRGGRR